MAKIIDKGFCEEDDPIFTEGITVFSRRSQKPRSRRKTLADVSRNAGSTLTLQAEDEQQAEEEKSSDK
jgi:hypothetical protein